jgi:uncharacterized membrane protein YgdD (TMEM256/DUF423 family)
LPCEQDLMNWMIVAGAANGALAVLAGAFGAHGLKARLTPELLATWNTGADYHMYHALALVLAGVLAGAQPSATLQVSGAALLAGILLFSGSLYLLALTGVKMLGAVTPFGGLAFVVGWCALAWAAWRGLP